MRLLYLVIAASLLVSCTNEAYETGDSRYSYLRTDFAEARTNASAQLVSATTDDGVSLTFTKAVSTSWAATADSTYRTLLYYLCEDFSDSPATKQVEPVRAGRVYVLRPDTSAQARAAATDPVHLQSAWASANGAYANLGIALMTGVADSVDARQSLGLACDSVVTGGDGHHTYHYRITHSQGGVPQYYKSTIYVSIPRQQIVGGDKMVVTINTYDGTVAKDFAF